MLNPGYFPGPTCSVYAADWSHIFRRIFIHISRTSEPSKRSELRYNLHLRHFRVDGEPIILWCFQANTALFFLKHSVNNTAWVL